MADNIPLLQRMQSVYDQIVEKGNYTGGSVEAYHAWTAVEDGLMKQVFEIDKEVGAGVKVGRVMKIPYADGYAMYWVHKVNKNSVKVVHLPFWDAWQSPVVRGDGMVPMYIAQQYIGFSDGMKKMFGNSALDK